MHALNWFEIPVTDFERAQKFYAQIFACEIPANPMQGEMLGFLPCDPTVGGVGGALVHGDGYTPSEYGTVVYLNGGDDLQVILDRVEAAGGKILADKFLITETIGYCAFFLDSEGNRVGLHSRS